MNAKVRIMPPVYCGSHECAKQTLDLLDRIERLRAENERLLRALHREADTHLDRRAPHTARPVTQSQAARLHERKHK